MTRTSWRAWAATSSCTEPANDAAIGEIAQRVVDAVAEPFAVGERELFISASVGVAVGGLGAGAEGLLRDADAAMYRAKEQGGGRFEVFDAELRARLTKRVSTEVALRRALERDEFEVRYQPIVELRSGRPAAFEALLRWDQADRGPITPAEFIPIAESTGLIIPLGRWVLNEALATTRAWQVSLGRPDLGISVNVSPRQLEHPGFAADVASALERSGIDPECLILEITESAILDIPSTERLLHELKRTGVRIAIDDFGTGYSSLSYVGRLPVDEVKVDRSFVAALGSDRKEAALAASVIQLGSTLDLVTLAEGIEDLAQLETLRALGCDLAQGYFIARPMVPERMEELLAAPVAARGGLTSLPVVRPDGAAA